MDIIMHGWTGILLHIDLSLKKSTTIDIAHDSLNLFIGGKGIAGHLLCDHVTRPWDDPAMPLIFMTGPLTGTIAPASGRMTIMSRSPLTGTVCDASVGGKLATQIKRAGYDGIILTGRAGSLTGITIDDGVVEFVDAASYTGFTTDAMFKSLNGPGSLAVVGPGAENGVLFANICVDGRYFAGRGGLGLVMASKRVKYLHVLGSGRISVYDKGELTAAREDILRLSAASQVLQGEFGIANFGTAALYDLMYNRRMMPTDNFIKTWFSDAPECNSYQIKQKYGYKKEGCNGCHILCKRTGTKGEELPEFETLNHFTALIGNSDLQLVHDANLICSHMGIDTISAGVTLACYQEISGKRLDKEAVLSLLTDIGLDRGLGSQLKTGSYRYADSQGRVETSMTVKKMELPAYDPRGAYGMALAYATSTRGACHLRAYPIAHEILRKPVVTDRFTFSGKARIIKSGEDLNSVIDSLVACKFLFFGASLEEYSRALYGATGLSTNARDLLRCGERVYYHERIMNWYNGFCDVDDDLPARFFEMDGSSGESVNILALDREQFLETRARYYKIRGLDMHGIPQKKVALDLDLPWKD